MFSASQPAEVVMNAKRSRPCIITAHLPLLRIEPERLSFSDFHLWRMPFEVYNDLTGGNLSSLQTAYQAVAPVFLQFSAEAEVQDGQEDRQPEGAGRPDRETEMEGEHIIEMRSQDSAYQSLVWLGLRSAAGAIRTIWSLVSLTFPSLLLPDPGLSQVFIHVEEGKIGLSNVRSSRACVQGPADYEYLFLDIPHQRTLKAEDFSRLEDTHALIDALYTEPFPRPALESFLDSLSPVFGSAERTALCVIALESLLMPEITEDLTKTFARRLANLLKGGESGEDVDEPLARRLYGARSDEMHGAIPSVSRSAAGLAMAATRALSGAVFNTAKLVQTGLTIDEIRPAVDVASAVASPQPEQSSTVSKDEGAANRLFLRERISVILAGQDSLATKDGEAACWSPLAGLEAREWVPFGRSGHPILLAPLNGNEILSLEEKETRADYAAQLRLIDDRVAGFFVPISLNMDRLDPQQIDAAMQLASRVRDFGTIALRMAGFNEFWDPEWHGVALFVGSTRIRRPTVFRQSVLFSIHRSIVLADHDGTSLPAITPADEPVLRPIWEMLSPHLEECPAPIERSLSLFRRSCDPAFLSPALRLRLAFAALESMLGRLAGTTGGASTEDIVVRLMDGREPEAAEWFLRNGRQHRNAVAHNSHLDSDIGNHLPWLLAILRAVLPAYLTAWADPDLVQFATPSRKLAEWVLRR
jgi:hypothetical protein